MDSNPPPFKIILIHNSHVADLAKELTRMARVLRTDAPEYAKAVMDDVAKATSIRATYHMGRRTSPVVEACKHRIRRTNARKIYTLNGRGNSSCISHYDSLAAYLLNPKS